VKKILIVLGIALVLGAILVWRGRPDPVAVWVAKADMGAVEKTVANTRAGTIKACRRSKLSMPMGGVVDKLLVKEGDRVEAGQLLLELWNRDRHAEVEAAQAALQSAKNSQIQICVMAERSAREAQRLQTLAARKLISVDAADNAASNAAAQKGACAAAQAQSNSAAAQLGMQQALLERFQLHAPFAGVIAEINGEIGEYVTPSPPGVATPPAVDLSIPLASMPPRPSTRSTPPRCSSACPSKSRSMHFAAASLRASSRVSRRMCSISKSRRAPSMSMCASTKCRRTSYC